MIQKKGFFVAEGLDPSGCGPCEFKIAIKRVEHLSTYGPKHLYYDLFSALEVLKDPVVIYEGLKRDGQEKGLCYVGRPKCYGEDWSGPPHPKMVFIVCVTKEKAIFEWGWEREDSASPGCPLQSKPRFGKTLWKHSSTT